MHCFAKVAKDASGHALVSSLPNGYGPADWHRAYGSTGLATPRIGIIVAYGDADLTSDISRYNTAFGLAGLSECTTAAQDSCLDLRTQNGGKGTTGADSGWAMETALDAETIHGLCPQCRLEIIAANSATSSDLLAAVDQSIRLGSTIISMSWGGKEFAAEGTLESHFKGTRLTFIASSGDNGYGTSWPSASPNIIAVGGTNLTFAGAIPHEVAWTGSGSGCSKYEAKPTWQKDSICLHRTIADISADADPVTGAAVYRGAWYRVGGTSLAAPIVAGYAASHGGLASTHLYNSISNLRDIVSGINGLCSQSKSYLCHAQPGYDGPTGLGVLGNRFAW
jgi:subtilase family serine protease